MFWCVPDPLNEDEIRDIKKTVVKERKDILAAKMAALKINTPTKTGKPKKSIKVVNSGGSSGSGKKATASKPDGKVSPAVLEFHDL